MVSVYYAFTRMKKEINADVNHDFSYRPKLDNWQIESQIDKLSSQWIVD